MSPKEAVTRRGKAHKLNEVQLADRGNRGVSGEEGGEIIASGPDVFSPALGCRQRNRGVGGRKSSRCGDGDGEPLGWKRDTRQQVSLCSQSEKSRSSH